MISPYEMTLQDLPVSMMRESGLEAFGDLRHWLLASSLIVIWEGKIFGISYILSERAMIRYRGANRRIVVRQASATAESCVNFIVYFELLHRDLLD